MNKAIHIVTFDVPYPANYGGAIDVFYQIKALHALGINITLHCFEYGKRSRQSELEKYCNTIYYYPRKSYLHFLFSNTPFIIASRKNNELLNNLLIDDSPILFEAIHSAALINDPALIHRKKIIRTLNVESDYYLQLSNHEKNIFKKIYYKLESKRLLHFETNLLHNIEIISIANQDQFFFQQHYPLENCRIITAFHPFDTITIKPENGSYCLYHGNLSIAENNSSALWLVEHVFSTLQTPLIIAGSKPSEMLLQAAKPYKHIAVIANPSESKMNELIYNAQLHVLPSFQNTGLKLKLLHALFTGRHCIVNNDMLTGTSLHATCIIATDSKDWQEKISTYFSKSFSITEIDIRKFVLNKEYNVKSNAEALQKIILNKE